VKVASPSDPDVTWRKKKFIKEGLDQYRSLEDSCRKAKYNRYGKVEYSDQKKGVDFIQKLKKWWDGVFKHKEGE